MTFEEWYDEYWRCADWSDGQEAYNAAYRAWIAGAEARELRALLAEAETYVRAYKCQCHAPGGRDGASNLLKRIAELETKP